MIKITSNLKEVLKRSLPTEKELLSRSNNSLNKLGEVLAYETRKSMEEPKTGRTYWNPHIKSNYVASAPEEGLANYSGETSKSITYYLSPNLLVFGGNTEQLLEWETAPPKFNRPTLKNMVMRYNYLFKKYYLTYKG